MYVCVVSCNISASQDHPIPINITNKVSIQKKHPSQTGGCVFVKFTLKI